MTLTAAQLLGSCCSIPGYYCFQPCIKYSGLTQWTHWPAVEQSNHYIALESNHAVIQQFLHKCISYTTLNTSVCYSNQRYVGTFADCYVYKRVINLGQSGFLPDSDMHAD